MIFWNLFEYLLLGKKKRFIFFGIPKRKTIIISAIQYIFPIGFIPHLGYSRRRRLYYRCTRAIA